MPTIPFNRPSIVGSEMSYIADAIHSGHISGNGKFTKMAEAAISEHSGAFGSLMTTSCTHALELVARVLDLGPEDEVIVPAYTFVSTASAFALTGAKIIFADVLEETLSLDPSHVSELLNARTKVICTVHYAGIGDQIDRLAEISQKHGVFLIEDNAHGFGATYKDRKLGSFGQFSTLSFHETKNISCGEGGALTFNSGEFIDLAEILREKGTDRSRFLRGQVDKYTWKKLGSSWVPSDLLAGYLLGQLEKFTEVQERRMRIWQSYHNQLADWAKAQGIRVPVVPEGSEHSAHMYYLRLPNGSTRDRFISHMREHGVMTVFHYQALNASPLGVELGGRVGQCPVSETASETLVRLPMFESLSMNEVQHVVSAAQSFEF